MIKVPPEAIKNILVLNLGGIGDLFFSMPALKAIRKFYPQSQVTLLTIPRSGEIAKAFQEDYRLVDKVLIFKGIFDAMSSLRKERYDLTVNMRTLASWGGALKMAWLFFLSGAKYKAGRDTQGRGFFLNLKLPEKDIAAMHDLDYDLSLAGMLGANDIRGRRLELPVRPEDRAYIENFLSRHQVKKEDVLIAVNPTATWQSKSWPIENFARVIRALSGEGNYKIVITGAAANKNLALRLRRLSGEAVIIACGETNVRQLAALIERSNLFITNDGGAMHIGAILKRPMVAIFGPTDVVRFGFYEKYDKGIILHKKAPCAPCFKKKCGPLKCLKSISPQEVIDVARKLLAPEV